MKDEFEDETLEGEEGRKEDEREAVARIEPIEEDGGTGPIILTPEARREYLGRLQDFAIRLEELPEMQGAFVLAMLKDPTNFTAAAKVAGYKFPNVESQRLLNNPKVAAAIAAGEQLREDRTYLTSDRTLHEFAIIAFSDITNYVIVDGNLQCKEGVPAWATRAVSTVEVEETSWMEDDVLHKRVKTKIKLWSKTDALKMLAMYQRLLSGPDGSNLGSGGNTIINNNGGVVNHHEYKKNKWVVGNVTMEF